MTRDDGMGLETALASMAGLGFEKEDGRVSYWSDVRPLGVEGGVAFFAHGVGMAFHYPKLGIVRPCVVPCLGFVEIDTCVSGYAMKKWRVYDLLPEAMEDDRANSWRAVWENVADFPTSYYLNVCRPGWFRRDDATGVVYLRDLYLDVVKVVVARHVEMTESERAVHADLLARGLLVRRGPVTLGGRGVEARPFEVEEFRAEIVDVDELEAAHARGSLCPTEAAEARALAADLLERVKGEVFPYDRATLERYFPLAFAARPRPRRSVGRASGPPG